MADVSNIRGYDVKDASARKQISEHRIDTIHRFAVNDEKFAGLDRDIDELHSLRFRPFADRRKRFYVDGVNGNDNNTGKSDSPFKTVQRVFEEANNGAPDVRCYVLSPGVYTIDKGVLTSCCVHITGNVDGVILDYSPVNEDAPFYMCHHNLNNVTLRNTKGTIYWDNANLTAQQVVFETRTRINGGTALFHSCTFYELGCEGAFVQFDGTTKLALRSGSGYPILLEACSVRFADDVETFAVGDGTNSKLVIHMTGCFFTWMASIKTYSTGAKYTYGVGLLECVGRITKTVLENFTTYSKDKVNSIRRSILLTSNKNIYLDSRDNPESGDVRYIDGALKYYNGSEWAAIE